MEDAMRNALDQKLAGYRQEMLFHFKELLKIDTVREEPLPGAPFGAGARRALDYVLELSRRFGLTTVDLDGYIGYSEYGEGDEYVCAIAHLDVVPVGDGWTHPPFAAEEEAGVLYARGAADDKPGCIAGLYALRCLKELGVRPARRIRVIYGCAEETGMEDAAWYLAREPLPLFGFTPDSDGYDIVNAEKGRMEFALSAPLPPASPLVELRGGLAGNMIPAEVTAVLDAARLTDAQRQALLRAAGPDTSVTDEAGRLTLTCRGVSAHAAFPAQGRSALALCARVLEPVLGDGCDALTRLAARMGFDCSGEALGVACADDFMGPLTLCLCSVDRQKDGLRAVGDIRYPACTDAAALTRALEASARGLGLDLEVLSAADGHHCVNEAAFEVLRRVCAGRGKPRPRCRALAGGTYAKKFAGRLVAFGGCGDKVHAPDEFVAVEDFYDHAGMVAAALARLSTEL